MSVDDARGARCSNNADAICCTIEFNAGRLGGCSQILVMTQKPAWLNGFRIVMFLARANKTNARQENFRADSHAGGVALRRFALCKFFFPESRREDVQTQNRVALVRISAR